jgi:hypothetical protein
MGMRRLAILLLLWLSMGVAYAAAPPPQWLARESWPGGRQYDPRLARTVTFWGTGIPAAQVFASITEQTGVPLDFFPPDDDNARICLNLYLNPEQPPTLRDLLVQIGWTMDCAWAVEGKGEHSRYLLLHTTTGDKVFEKIQQESDAAARRRGEEWSRATAEHYAAAVAKLPELRDALRVSRDEAIKRYRGTDDAMLLTLLDPARRAVAQVTLSLPDDEVNQLEPFSGISRKWEELSPQQQAWVAEATKLALAQLADEVQKGWRDADQLWDPFSGEWDLRVGFAGTDGGFAIHVSGRAKQPLADGRRRAQSLDLGGITLCPVSDEQQLWDELALRRLLGEAVDENEGLTRAAELDTRRQSRQQRALVEQQLADLCRLSPETTNRLRALRLPVEMGARYALWQVQEAVAARTGMHVVSDHFAQPPRLPEDVLASLHPEQEFAPDALSLLQANCTALGEREQIRSGAGSFSYVVRWEWGDAGDFLRFRSADRDAWRAAFLPAEVVATLDEWLPPYLPRDPATATSAAVPLDVRHTGALLARLDMMQRLWGGALAYGSPLDEAEQWRQAFRTRFAQVTQRPPGQPSFYVMLSGLDDAQWEQAQAEGLRVGVDVALKADLDVDTHGRSPRDWQQDWQGQRLRIVPEEPPRRPLEARRGGGMAYFEGSPTRRVEVVVQPDGAPPDWGYRQSLAIEVVIHPERLRPL